MAYAVDVGVAQDECSGCCVGQPPGVLLVARVCKPCWAGDVRVRLGLVSFSLPECANRAGSEMCCGASVSHVCQSIRSRRSVSMSIRRSLRGLSPLRMMRKGESLGMTLMLWHAACMPMKLFACSEVVLMWAVDEWNVYAYVWEGGVCLTENPQDLLGGVVSGADTAVVIGAEIEYWSWGQVLGFS